MFVMHILTLGVQACAVSSSAGNSLYPLAAPEALCWGPSSLPLPLEVLDLQIFITSDKVIFGKCYEKRITKYY